MHADCKPVPYDLVISVLGNYLRQVNPVNVVNVGDNVLNSSDFLSFYVCLCTAASGNNDDIIHCINSRLSIGCDATGSNTGISYS